MDITELALNLNRCEYGLKEKDELIAEAKESGLVIVYGANDNLIEFRGVINCEIEVIGGEWLMIDKNGVLPFFENIELESEAEKYFCRKSKAGKIKCFWHADGKYSWTYETDIPHEKFNVMDGSEYYCEGIVLHVSGLGTIKESDIIEVTEWELETTRNQATILANALTDINNAVGEVKEVKDTYKTVENIISIYAGL